jgi:PAS domain S-box-containing protein
LHLRADALQREVLQRERVERALRRSEENLRELIEAAIDIIFTLSSDGRLLSVNPAFEASTGRLREAAVGRPLEDFVLSEDFVALRGAIDRVLFEGRPQSIVIRFLRADGRRLAIDLHLSHRENGGRNVPLLGIGRDITERQLLEEQVRQAQKMESIGLLAAGVAHDFNNILTVVRGQSSFILKDPGSPELVRECATAIAGAAERATNLTRQLLAFGRRSRMQKTVLDLHKVVQDVIGMLRRLVPDAIELVFDPVREAAHVVADAGMVEQVFMNLVVNARDAMPDGGTVRITTRLHAAGTVARPGGSQVEPGGVVQLSVADTGTGMPAAMLAHIFDPFYTTKPVGQGTGLGLATVHGIVEQHGGWITVESTPGHGTTFGIHLPATTEAADHRTENTDPPAETSRGSETILLVEDEPAVRSMARRVLERHGYCVLEAGTGEAALEIWENSRDSVDLVVTDVAMPGMTGYQLADRILENKPDARIVIVSGHFPASGANSPPRSGSVAFMQKPYDTRELLRAVRARLEVPR